MGFSRQEYWSGLLQEVAGRKPGLLQVAFPFSSGSSPPRDQTWVSCIAGRFFTNWATRWASIHSLKYSKFIPLSTVFSFRCALRDAVRKNHCSYHERWGQGSLLPTEPSFWGLKGDVSLHFRTRKSCATLCATLLASQQPFRFTLGTPSIMCLAPCPSAPDAGGLRRAPMTHLCQLSWASLCKLWANFTSPTLDFSFLPFLLTWYLFSFLSQVGFWVFVHDSRSPEGKLEMEH